MNDTLTLAMLLHAAQSDDEPAEAARKFAEWAATPEGQAAIADDGAGVRLSEGWDESKHPRADDGKFGSGGGHKKKPDDATPKPAPKSLKSSPSHPDYQTAKARVEKLKEAARQSATTVEEWDAREEAKATLRRSKEALSQEARKCLIQTHHEPFDKISENQPKVRIVDRMKREKSDRIQNAFAFIGEIMHGPSHSEKHSVAVGNTQKSNSRSSYLGWIRLAPNDGESIVLHEYGHHLEKQEWVKERVAAFQEKRFDGEEPVSLRDKFGRFDPDEVGRKDDMEKLFPDDPESAYYVGKTYPGGETEILSMGLQLMYEDPVHFEETDPEYFGLVLGILKGEGRR
jgi:hypothetical protein